MGGRLQGLAASALALTTLASAACGSGAAETAGDDDAVRFYERDPAGGLAESRLDGRRRPGAVVPIATLQPVGEADVQARLRLAGQERDATLASGAREPVGTRLVPEELTRRPLVVHVAVEHWTEAAFAEVAARVGQVEGFAVIARLAPESEWTAHLRDVPGLALIDLPGRAYIWTEDVAEIRVDGAFQMTARMGDRALLRRTLFVDRVRRLHPETTRADLEALRAMPAVPGGGPPGELPPDVMRRYPRILFMLQGLVERDGGHEVAAALAAARGAELREATTYLEGGNVLLGTLPSGEPYALVGRDSAAVARAMLERRARRAVGEAEVVAAMAGDIGVDPARLVLVEQPGVFHLDMAMTLLAPGLVVLNDAREAHRLQAAWLREDHAAWRPHGAAARDLELWQEAGRALEGTIEVLAKHAERFAQLEAMALADLQSAGLEVVRVPGRFPHPTLPWERDIMNFLNGEAGTSARGRRYFITQGGDPRAERIIAARLLAPGTGLDRIYVAPRLASRDTLWEKGGIGCRLKVEGEVSEHHRAPAATPDRAGATSHRSGATSRPSEREPAGNGPRLTR